MGILKCMKNLFGAASDEDLSSKERHEKAKSLVGYAPTGTQQCYRNSAIVLSQHAGQDMQLETRQKLEQLAQSGDPETSRIAQEALNGTRYKV